VAELGLSLEVLSTGLWHVPTIFSFGKERIWSWKLVAVQVVILNLFNSSSCPFLPRNGRTDQAQDNCWVLCLGWLCQKVPSLACRDKLRVAGYRDILLASAVCIMGQEP
jgi:hypothetical protein